MGKVYHPIAALSAAILLAGAFLSPAADKLWTGAVSTDWFEPNNWEPPGVPQREDTAFLSKTGTVNIASDVIIHSLNLGGSFTPPRILDGSGNLTITNFNWTNGVLTGSGTCTIPVGGTLRLGPGPFGGGRDLRRTLINFGTIRQSDYFFLAATLRNEGLFEIQGRWAEIAGDPSRGLLQNAGIFQKNNEVWTNAIRVPFENQSEMTLLAGTLQLTESHTNTGVVEISASATLELTKSNVIGRSCSLRGSGKLRFISFFNQTPASTVLTTNPIHPRLEIVYPTEGSQGPILSFDSSLSIHECLLEGGAISGAGTLTVTNLIWMKGRIYGSGTLVIPPDGSFVITGYNDGRGDDFKQLDARTIINQGNLEWLTSDIFGTSSTLFNRGSFRALANVYWGGRIVNEGNFFRSGISTHWTVNLVTNSGLVEVQSGNLNVHSYTQLDGETRLSGGRLNLAGYLFLFDGSLQGTGVVAGAVTSYRGHINPGNPIGVLTIDGSLGQYAKLTIEIGGTNPGIDFDQLIITRGAGVETFLKVVLTNGFRPQLGDRFEIIKYTNATANVSRISGSDLGDGLILLSEFSSTNLVLVVTNAPANTFYVVKNLTDPVRHHIVFHGSPAADYVLQASTNLRNWVDLFSNDEPIDYVNYINQQWQVPYRFFRVRWGD